MSAPEFVSLLQCPACRRAPLVAAGEGYACRACRRDYPRVGGVPWLFPDPAAALAEWRNRIALYLAEFAQEAQRARADLAAPDVRPAGRARIEHLARAFDEQRALVASLLEPVGAAAGSLLHATELAVGTSLPASQDLHSYYSNLHRDWAWGGVENEAAARLVGDALGGPRERVLVLGAGAGRLAYDLHEGVTHAGTVALDLSPLLLLAAARLAAGGRVELYEFPIAPRSAADVAVRRTLAAPRPARPGLEFVLADAWHAPFAPQTFDAVVTPWLVDIVELDFDGVAAHVNRLLKPGGRWVNFGSLAFAWRRPAARWCADEVVAAVTEAGFDVRDALDVELPYMQSPASRHGRIERVFTFAADKVRRGPREAAPPEPPPWLADARLPVPRTAELELAATAARIRAVLLALADGTRSLDEIARIVAEQGLLGGDDARAAVRELFGRLHVEATKGVPRVS